jgi:hypothetical protein
MVARLARALHQARDIGRGPGIDGAHDRRVEVVGDLGGGHPSGQAASYQQSDADELASMVAGALDG